MDVNTVNNGHVKQLNFGPLAHSILKAESRQFRSSNLINSQCDHRSTLKKAYFRDRYAICFSKSFGLRTEKSAILQ